MSHTPGPLTVHGPLEASHGFQWEVSTEDGHGIWTAHCQRKEDAVLYAAAPELLEQLILAPNTYDFNSADAFFEEYDSWMKGRKAAIAKAEAK